MECIGLPPNIFFLQNDAVCIQLLPPWTNHKRFNHHIRMLIENNQKSEDITKYQFGSNPATADFIERWGK
ncbi:UNVERIFIED_CONTAM: hypothetical protein PYX00_003693 [Menopon gallinae]|uniref:Uncharacterized protein n=1 Tax=Menopon gallinae TaxID=328185 RepID=A0AAW2I2H8_9NEOP